MSTQETHNLSVVGADREGTVRWLDVGADKCSWSAGGREVTGKKSHSSLILFILSRGESAAQGIRRYITWGQRRNSLNECNWWLNLTLFWEAMGDWSTAESGVSRTLGKKSKMGWLAASVTKHWRKWRQRSKIHGTLLGVSRSRWICWSSPVHTGCTPDSQAGP